MASLGQMIIYLFRAAPLARSLATVIGYWLKTERAKRERERERGRGGRERTEKGGGRDGGSMHGHWGGWEAHIVKTPQILFSFVYVVETD